MWCDVYRKVFIESIWILIYWSEILRQLDFYGELTNKQNINLDRRRKDNTSVECPNNMML